MLTMMEIRRVMEYPDDFRFAGPDDTEPSNRDKVRLLGDGVTPPVLTWLTGRTLRVLDQASAVQAASSRGRPRAPLTATPSPPDSAPPRSGPSRRPS